MSKSFREDLTGKRFGRLVVLEFVPNDKSGSFWKCMCDCGNIHTVYGSDLKNGHTKSCGCINLKHGLTNTKLFSVWHGFKSRCYNKNTRSYKNYGGRGIKVCEEWRNDFMSFYNWAINNGYHDDLTLDRIDVDGNYCPDNCKWICSKEQHRNTRKNIFVEYQGKKMCLAEVAECSGISKHVLYQRYKSGKRSTDLIVPTREHKKRK